MKGSIRFFLGFIVLFGAVGGIENSITDVQLVQACGIALIGLLLMLSGSNALNKLER